MRTFSTYVVLLLIISTLSLRAQNYIVHKVKQGETIYALAKKYNVTVNDIYKNNSSLANGTLKIGTEIRIPNNKPSITNKSNQNNIKKNISESKSINQFDTIFHQVKAKETMYALSKQYQVSIDEIKKWNNLQTTDLDINSVVKIYKSKETNLKHENNITSNLNKEETKKIIDKVSKTKEDKISKPIEQSKPNVPTTTEAKPQIDNTKIDTPKSNDEPLIKILPLSEQFALQKKEHETKSAKATGAAMSTNDPSINNTYFALHKTAKVGSIIKIKNLENNKITHAKVIGTLPEIDENKNIMIRISLGARKSINMGNGKAYLEMEFVE